MAIEFVGQLIIDLVMCSACACMHVRHVRQRTCDFLLFVCSTVYIYTCGVKYIHINYCAPASSIVRMIECYLHAGARRV